jgi:predicted phosphodiesterase
MAMKCFRKKGWQEMKNPWLWISLLAALLFGGCGLQDLGGTGDETRTMDGIDYGIQDNRMTQLSGEKKSHRILVMADIHGCLQNEDNLIARAEGKFDYVVLLGDYVSLWNLFETHYEWIYAALERAAKTGKPVFVLNGNHDNQLVFETVLSDLAATYPNLIDVRRLRKIDLKGLNFIGSPGGSDYTFILNGFQTDEESMDETRRDAEELNDGDPTIVLSHPFKDVDTILYGHTHIRAAEDKAGNEIAEGRYSASLRFNPGAVSPETFYCGIGSAGLVEVDPEKGIRYEYLSSE